MQLWQLHTFTLNWEFKQQQIMNRKVNISLNMLNIQLYNVSRAPDNFLLQRVFTPWFWSQRVFCFLEKVERVYCKFTDFFFRNTNKCDYPVKRICYYIVRCLTFETVLSFLQRNILDKCALQLGWRHNQRIACLTSAIPALSNNHVNHGFFK
jgi:hypothetical protein